MGSAVALTAWTSGHICSYCNTFAQMFAAWLMPPPAESYHPQSDIFFAFLDSTLL
jgi:hypothetical protein